MLLEESKVGLNYENITMIEYSGSPQESIKDDKIDDLQFGALDKIFFSRARYSSPCISLK